MGHAADCRSIHRRGTTTATAVWLISLAVGVAFGLYVVGQATRPNHGLSQFGSYDECEAASWTTAAQCSAAFPH